MRMKSSPWEENASCLDPGWPFLDLTSGEHTHSRAVEKITKAEACETLSIYLTGAEQTGAVIELALIGGRAGM